MIRDYWIYQNADSTTPWALYVVKEFSKSYPQSIALSYTLYSENIDNKLNSVSRVSIHYDTVKGYVNAIIIDMIDNGISVDSRDNDQLEREILAILND